jgi:exodeoxyribonuclease VII small subunit
MFDKPMTDDPKNFDFTMSIKQLEEINSWFQNEDFNLDEGLQKLKVGKDLIKKCRGRLQQVENEFVKIKQEFVDDVADGETSRVFQQREDSTTTLKKNGEIDPNDVPF